MISKTQCLYLFLLLYGGTLLALFVRAFVRRRLLADHEKLLGTWKPATHEGLLQRALMAVPRQSAALRSLGKTLDSAPTRVQLRYRRFRVLTWTAVALLILLVTFSFGAHRVCGG
jgi:hypothetical protein